MNQSPTWRRGQPAVGARARQIPTEAHEGTPGAFLRRHEMEAREAAGNPGLREQLLPKLLHRVGDSRNLKLALDHVAHNGDRTARTLDPDERWQLARVLGSAIRNGSYRPGPGRTRQEPKSSGKGFRTLTIQDYVDRTVERAVVQIIQPFLDRLFLDSSFGYRPGMGRLDALVQGETFAETDRRWFWIAEDLADAFDHVPQRRLLDVIHRYVPDEGIISLVRRLVVTRRGTGIRQGGPLSPMLLNLFLHHLVDRPWRQRLPEVPLIRVADDLLVLCESEEEAVVAHDVLKRLVADMGMSLKATSQPAIRKLANGDRVTWLGFTLSKRNEQLQVNLSEKSWRTLERRITECHDKIDPTIRVIEVLRGWVSQIGPTRPYEDNREVFADVSNIANAQAFEEIPCYEEFLKWWNEAFSKWERKRSHFRSTTHATRGSASAEAIRADSGLCPGGLSERDSPSGTSFEPISYTLSVCGSCREPGRRGSWVYTLTNSRGEDAQIRRGDSPHTTIERMELLAVLRGLEVVPPGSRVSLLLEPGSYLAEGIDTLRHVGEMGEDGPAADLWRRLRTAMANFDLTINGHAEASSATQG